MIDPDEAAANGETKASEATGPAAPRGGDDDEEAVVLTPQEALALAIQQHKAGDRKTARTVYEAILNHEPENPVALQFMGVLEHQEGRHEEALARLRAAAAIMPEDPGLWTNTGNVLVETDRPQEAVEAYRKAIEIAPQFPMPYNNVGTILRASGQNELAEEAFRRAIELDPDYASAWHNLGNLLLATKRTQEAITCALRAVTLVPKGTVERKLLGLAHIRLGEMDKARALYTEWLEEDPDNPHARHHLAACLGEPPDRASDAYVQATFDTFAKSFDSKLAHLQYKAPSLVEEALGRHGPLPEGAAILDAGCGTGLCSPFLRPLAGRLVGVDLSSGMLERAAGRAAYDALFQGELTAFMKEHPRAFDAVIICDTLCYFGQLDAVAAAVAAALRPGGILVATFEALGEDEDRFHLAHHGRYAHGGRFVDGAARAAGLVVEERSPAVLRREQDEPVNGWVLAARLPA